MNFCVTVYTQSDEITLILVDYKNLNSSAWFDYEVQKMCSISASMATMFFNKYFRQKLDEIHEDMMEAWNVPDDMYKLVETYEKAIDKGAMFDARVFNIPKEEVTNLIYWRQLDATRNSIQMVGQANFSHNELQNKSCNVIQEMLFQERDINWNDYPAHLKRGSCCIKIEDERSFWFIDKNIPIFKDEDREYINKRILYAEEPKLAVIS